MQSSTAATSAAAVPTQPARISSASQIELEALSPLDGRYASRVKQLTKYFSEQAWFGARLRVEVEYLIALSRLLLPDSPLSVLTPELCEKLRALYQNFSTEQAVRMKEIEAVTNHDVKAVEYYLKEELQRLGVPADSRLIEMVHFGLTSQDVNNTALPLLVREAYEQVLLPALDELTDTLRRLGTEFREEAMLARTHGQPATPTRLGKELLVFVERLVRARRLLVAVPHSCKFGGATGQLNAHYVAFPEACADATSFFFFWRR
jgi:adenylosuccinate lyase